MNLQPVLGFCGHGELMMQRMRMMQRCRWCRDADDAEMPPGFRPLQVRHAPVDSHIPVHTQATLNKLRGIQSFKNIHLDFLKQSASELWAHWFGCSDWPARSRICLSLPSLHWGSRCMPPCLANVDSGRRSSGPHACTTIALLTHVTSWLLVSYP